MYKPAEYWHHVTMQTESDGYRIRAERAEQALALPDVCELNLKGWETRITEALCGMIKMYVEDTQCLPSPKEYGKMARQAIETASQGF